MMHYSFTAVRETEFSPAKAAASSGCNLMQPAFYFVGNAPNLDGLLVMKIHRISVNVF